MDSEIKKGKIEAQFKFWDTATWVIALITIIAVFAVYTSGFAARQGIAIALLALGMTCIVVANEICNMFRRRLERPKRPFYFCPCCHEDNDHSHHGEDEL